MAKLVLVPTPIGNLEDMTHRAVRLLKECAFVLAEDTRTSSFLFKHYGIETPLQSFHKFNEHKMLDAVVARIASVDMAGLVSDAGTPGISDPGFLLVRKCIEEGIEVECLPGASALLPALVQSGFPTDKFVFEGFLPHKKGRQTTWLRLKEETRTVVLYESPHRLLKALEEICEFISPDREVAVCRELTKKFEETRRGKASEVLDYFKSKAIKGEIVLVMKGAE
ncbi:MAG: 16S rRNA (cytidine(1402)-2'-O)-methyltransferase [Flavobacteriales bacterium]|nr:16S rRNA (cytidine(1402)-2'-O)-methyltransferase [Flavobacteriales bacterium]